MTGRLTVRPLYSGNRELGPDLDLHLEHHRAIVGQRDRLDVELGLGDRIELVIRVELFQSEAIKSVDLT